MDKSSANGFTTSGDVAVPPGGKEHRVLFLAFESDSHLDGPQLVKLESLLEEGSIVDLPIVPSGVTMIRLCWTVAAGIPEVVMGEMKPLRPSNSKL